MGPSYAIRNGLGKTFAFNGRASRPEFWWFAAAWAPLVFAVTLALHAITDTADAILLAFFSMVVALFPLISASARRLNDAGRDAAWAGWGISALLFGNGLVDLASNPVPYDIPNSLKLIGLASIATGLIVLVYSLSRPSSIGPKPHEENP